MFKNLFLINICFTIELIRIFVFHPLSDTSANSLANSLSNPIGTTATNILTSTLVKALANPVANTLTNTITNALANTLINTLANIITNALEKRFLILYIEWFSIKIIKGFLKVFVNVFVDPIAFTFEVGEIFFLLKRSCYKREGLIRSPLILNPNLDNILTVRYNLCLYYLVNYLQFFILQFWNYLS